MNSDVCMWFFFSQNCWRSNKKFYILGNIFSAHKIKCLEPKGKCRRNWNVLSSLEPFMHIGLFFFVWLIRPRRLPPYRGEVCVQQWPGQLCWRERKLLVGPRMSDRTKGRGQTKCSPWSSRLGVRRGINDPTPENFTVTEPPEEHT
jgi:hypothetical protein